MLDSYLVNNSYGGYAFQTEVHSIALNLVASMGSIRSRKQKIVISLIIYETTGGDHCTKSGFLDRLSLLSPPSRPHPVADHEHGTVYSDDF